MVHPTPALLKALHQKNDAFEVANTAYQNYLKAKSACRDTTELEKEVVRTEALYQKAVADSRIELADTE